MSYLINNDNHQKLKDSPEYTATITKDQALKITQKYIPINSLNDLIDETAHSTNSLMNYVMTIAVKRF